MRNNLDCRPYPGIAHNAQKPASILELAACASSAANEYQRVIDARESFDASMRAGRAMAIATQALTTAIADAVACGDNRLS